MTKKGMYDTNTQVMEALKEIVTNNPKSCALHAKKLEVFTEKMDLYHTSITELKEDFKEMNRKLFVTNGEVCMSENIRNNKGDIKRHLDYHTDLKTDSKWTLSQIVTLCIAIVMIIVTVWLSYRTNAKEEKDLYELKEEIAKEISKRHKE